MDKDKRMGSIWEPVDASPADIALVCMQGPPKEQWDYLTKGEPPDDEPESV